MTPHFWIEWKRPWKIVVFIATMVAVALYWSHLSHLITRGVRVPRGGPGDFVAIMFIGWVGGWFLILFVRAQDLNLTTSYPYQSACRAIGALLVFLGSAAGGFLAIAFRA